MKACYLLIGILALTAWAGAQGLEPDPILDDGLTARERLAIHGDGSGDDRGGRAVQDIVIVDTTRPNAYFGMYRTSQMTAPGWDLYKRTFDWANGFGSYATTKIWLATYNGSLDPKYSAELDGIAVYDYLTTILGVPASNIMVAPQTTIETGNFSNYDIVLYVHSYPRDATNVMNQNIPFVTTSGGETDEMGIGTGVSTMHMSRNYAYIVNNIHHVTSPYGIGNFNLASSMWMDATEASGNGQVLIAAEAYPLMVDNMKISAGLGGVSNFALDAGLGNSNRNYFILGSITGTSPGLPLPGGMVTLPLVWDFITDQLISMANSLFLVNFHSVLDGSGQSTAQLNTYGSLPPSAAGATLYFAYLLYYPVVFYPYDFVSNPIPIQFVP